MNGTKYGGYHSYDKFGLLRSARAIISNPVVKTHIVDNPGGNGSINLTTSLTGVPLYNNRTITESFIVPFGAKKWDALLSELFQYLDGQPMSLIMDSDPGYYWNAVSTVSGVDKSSDTHMKLNIVSDVEPFKYERYSSAEDWEWDHFNFETGVIRDYRDIYVDGELDFEIIGSKAPVIPGFILADVTSDISVGYYDAVLDKSVLVNLSENEDTSDIIIREGINTLHFYGVGYVTIDYRGGIL